MKQASRNSFFCPTCHSLTAGSDSIPSFGPGSRIYHYLPLDAIPKPTEELVKILEERLRPVIQELNINLHVGGIWTTDAIFRQTRDKVRKYSSKGVLAVDMESTGLMAVAMHRNVELGIVHVVTDELYGEKWVMYGDDNKMAEIEKMIVESLIGTLANL